MPTEDTLIALLSRVELEDNALSLSANLFKENLDWQYLLKKSAEEGVSCLIYRHLKNSPFQESLPENILEPFKNIYYNNAKRNVFIYEKIKKVLGILAAEKIKTISLKGFFLAENIYRNIALRAMNDIDLLIRKEDIPRAVQILRSLGYSTQADYKKVLRQPFSYSITFFSNNPDDAQNLSIDLHWHFLSATWLMGFLGNRIDMERIWSSAEAVQIDGVDSLTLSPPHLLLYLAQHGFAHSFEKLIMLTDIREVLRCYKDRLVWDEVIAEAERSGLFNILSYALYLTSKRLGIDESWIADHQFLKKSFSSWVNSSKLPCLTYILLEKSWKDKLKYSLKAAHLLAYLAAGRHNLNP